MASNSPTPKLDRYVVYLPDGPRASAYPFRLPEGAKVRDLIYEIRKQWDGKRGLKDKDVYFYKGDDLDINPFNTLLSRCLNGLREGDREQMHFSHRLKQHFPNGPAPEDSDKIDVIVVTESILEYSVIESDKVPTTPENKAGLDFEGSRKSKLESDTLVQKYLRGLDKKFSEFLAGPPWKDFWIAPEYASPETAQFINSLEIPKRHDEPVLLLHGLGKDSGIVNEKVVEGLFANKSKFLVNTSGSGKTRLLFEGLSRHWGFYFSANVNDGLGSYDMMHAIDEFIPYSKGFKREPRNLDNGKRAEAYRLNHRIAKRRMHQVLIARIIVFDYFLKTAQGARRLESIGEFQKHWLFLQLFSSEIFGRDVFAHISYLLKDASDDYLMIYEPTIVGERLVELQEKFCLEKKFYLILDEAQDAIEKLNGCFCSGKKDELVNRPVLRPIVNAWSAASAERFPIIISGTGLSIDIVNEVVGSVFLKSAPFARVTRTGAFDTRERQLDYISRYMPPHIAESESGKEFLKRAWNFARGRYRITAALVAQLLRSSFQSPHKILNAYVEGLSGFYPIDGQQFSDKEAVIDVNNMIIQRALNFTKFSNDASKVDLFTAILYTWLIEQKPYNLTGDDKELVELGFARFTDTPEEYIAIDEPLVILAATNHFRSSKRFSLSGYIKKGLENPAGRGERFETLVTHYLVCAFGNEEKLCDVFKFGSEVPEWAKQRAELVSIVWNGEIADTHVFHLSSKGSSDFTVIGRNCESEKETMEWFEKPTTLMCFPDEFMGPDVVLFVRLASSGQILAVVIQCKWRSTETLDNSVQNQAYNTLDPSDFYKRKNLKDEKYAKARESILNIVRRLKRTDFEADGWFEDGLPMLKVIASFPAVAQQDRLPYCATLDMEKCAELIDKDDLLKVMKGVVKRGAEDKVNSPSCKRQRLE